ncbi:MULTISPECIES: AAA family ATPase [unclassified Shewanella]|uniref:AAA family ATPase n=1 Tax=unclassified Shewanella TaxID=196818 RepID=UPI0021D8CCD3|nr:MULTISPECIES: AAA family ATPase [unclassified Shewanella]MCU8045611.1 AAA family ATPase [Shewanella sp. SM68]MCU8049938.1 AAA family ATPase [Shewanella sp. SM65]
MAMNATEYMDFKNKVLAANAVSKFNVKLFDSGAYAQLTNSTGKVHDIGFESLKNFLIDLNDNAKVKNYIEICNKLPRKVLKDSSETVRMNRIIHDTENADLLLPSKWVYFEKAVRAICDMHVKDVRAQVLGSEQSKLFFNILSRLSHYANNIEMKPSLDDSMPFSDGNILKTINLLSDLIKYFDVGYKEFNSFVPSGLGINKIYYGAPGTGKSHKIDELAPEENSIRTVFHSETQYSDFVGCLKPCMNGSDISYQFRPGPFTLALVKAVSDTEAHFYLIIEEINRAAAAAVFGDIFQLLDRRDDGRSQYAIDVVDMDFKHYLENNCPSLLDRGRLILPSNLSLLATMNSSDQAVMPMDSAFKRRWQFEYVSIESDTYPRGHFNLNAGADTLTVSWENLSKVINNQLAGVQIPEDRLLGPWFVNENELQNSQATLAGKLAMYLWEDVLRHAHRESIFNTDKYPTLYQLIKGINANEMVFSDSIIIELHKLVEPLTPAEA